MESGKRTYQLVRQPVAPILDAALQAFQAQLLHVPAQVERDVPAKLPPVFADRAALSDAILNLLGNAHKYTGPDKRIAVRARVSGPMVVISVEDNGPGIPPGDEKRIFEKFYRARDPLARTIDGTGLGLAMVKHIANGHGGRVSAESQPGKGSTFSITLPAAEEG
jgi:two-component system, OmpR family, phosphate regulon sensor histidine kinase PhoR